MVDTCCNKTLSISPSHYQRTSSRALHVDSNHFIKSCKCTMWEQRIRMVNRWLNRFHCHVGHCKCCAPSQISRYYTATATFFKRLPLSVFQHYFAYPHGFCWTWCQTLSQESTVPHFTVEGKFLFLLSIFRISAWIVSIPLALWTTISQGSFGIRHCLSHDHSQCLVSLCTIESFQCQSLSANRCDTSAYWWRRLWQSISQVSDRRGKWSAILQVETC